MKNNVKDSLLPPKAEFGYIPGLDGMRAFAVMAVMAAHVGFDHLIPAGLGVTLFFFISGFLITRLLLAEQDKTGAIKIGHFYTRRFIRLLPALYVMLAVTVGLQIIMATPPNVWDTLAAFTYTMNYREIFLELSGIPRVGPWGHLWSLSVEEHFYLLFPLMVVAFKKHQKGLIVFCSLICLAALLWRINVFYNLQLPSHYSYAATEARIDSILYGCLFSLILNQASNWKILNRFLGFAPIAIAAIIMLLCLLYRDEGFRQTIRYSLQGIAIGVLILNLFYFKAMGVFIRLLELGPLRWTGKVSYGLYLWHIPAMFAVNQYLGYEEATLSFILITYSITFTVTALSFYFIEKPFIKLRHKYGSHKLERHKKASELTPSDAGSKEASAKTKPLKPMTS